MIVLAKTAGWDRFFEAILELSLFSFLYFSCSVDFFKIFISFGKWTLEFSFWYFVFLKKSLILLILLNCLFTMKWILLCCYQVRFEMFNLSNLKGFYMQIDCSYWWICRSVQRNLLKLFPRRFPKHSSSFTLRHFLNHLTKHSLRHTSFPVPQVLRTLAIRWCVLCILLCSFKRTLFSHFLLSVLNLAL